MRFPPAAVYLSIVLPCAVHTRLGAQDAPLASTELSRKEIAGTWVGQADVNDLGYFELRSSDTDTAAVADFPVRNRWDVAVLIKGGPHNYSFTFAISGGDTARVEATVIAGKILGTVRRSGTAGRFAANRVLRDVRAADELSGNYSAGKNTSLISVGATDGGYAFMFDARTNRVCRLEQLSDTVWAVGTGLGIAFPATSVIYTHRNSSGVVDTIRWKESGRVRVAARRNDYIRVPLSFSSANIPIAGELLLPNTRGRHPAVVLLHGSGPESHRDFHWLRYYLAAKGMAVVGYDKRGVGGSGGDWRSATFEDLAADAVAAARAVRSRRDIDSLSIGVLGWSNGGWVAPLAMANKEFAFGAVGAAPGTSSGENIAFEVAKDLEDAGFDKDTVAAAVAVRQHVTQFVVSHDAMSPASWDSLRAVVEHSRSARWFSRARLAWVLNVTPPPDTGTIALLRGLRQQWMSDPVPGWRKIHSPVFIMLGAKDNAVPGPQSAVRLRQAFHDAGNCKAFVKLYPDGSHALFRVHSLSQGDVLSATHYVQGFPSDLVNWLHSAPTGNRKPC